MIAMDYIPFFKAIRMHLERFIVCTFIPLAIMTARRPHPSEIGMITLVISQRGLGSASIL